MEVPPSEEGGFQVIVACPSLAVAETFVGGPGAAIGVITLDDKDDVDVPTLLIANTVKV